MKKEFSTFGYVEHTFSNNELLPIKNEIDSFVKNKKQFVWGSIDKEFSLIESKSYIEKLVMPLCSEHNQHFSSIDNLNILTNNCPITLTNLWVNFQRKHEYSPVHNHGGVYSFVIWINVPYFIENERKHESSRFCSTIGSSHNVSGCFDFVYSGSNGKLSTHSIPVDKTYENKCILFPSNLSHVVYPFYTSDECRISISGNFKFKVN